MLQVFLLTMQREWPGLDKFRYDAAATVAAGCRDLANVIVHCTVWTSTSP